MSWARHSNRFNNCWRYCLKFTYFRTLFFELTFYARGCALYINLGVATALSTARPRSVPLAHGRSRLTDLGFLSANVCRGSKRSFLALAECGVTAVHRSETSARRHGRCRRRQIEQRGAATQPTWRRLGVCSSRRCQSVCASGQDVVYARQRRRRVIDQRICWHQRHCGRRLDWRVVAGAARCHAVWQKAHTADRRSRPSLVARQSESRGGGALDRHACTRRLRAQTSPLGRRDTTGTGAHRATWRLSVTRPTTNLSPLAKPRLTALHQ